MASTCSSAALQAKFQNDVDFLPVGGNSPSSRQGETRGRA